MIRSLGRAYSRAFSGLPRQLWLLALVLLVNRAGTMVMPFLSLYLTQRLGLGVAAAGRLLGLWGVGALIGAALGGWLSDRIGPTRTQQLCLAFSGVGFLLLVRLRDLLWISIAIFLVGIVVEAFRPAAMADMTRRAPAGMRVRAFALLRLAANVGMGIGPSIGGLLALYDYDWLFVADAVTCWIAALLLFALREVPTDESEGGGADAGRAPWRDRPFLLLLGLVVLLAAVFFQMFSTLPLYLRQTYAYRESTIGLLLALNPLLIVLFEMLLSHWAEKRGQLRMLGIGAFLTCAGFGLLPLGSSLLFIAFAISVLTLGEMIAFPMMNALIAGRAGPRHRGRYMGMFTMAFAAAFIFAPALGSWIYERFGPDTLWYGVGSMGFVLLAGSLALRGVFARGAAADGEAP